LSGTNELAYLRLLERAAAAANQSTTLDEAVATVLREVCAFTGWPVGHLYVVPGPTRDLVEPTSTWFLADGGRFARFRQVTEASPLRVGEGLPGRVLATGKPEWVSDIRDDGNSPRAAVAQELGVQAGFAFPVIVGDDVVAVLEFFAEEPVAPDAGLLDLVASVGHQLARVVERAEATAALRQSEERYRALTQSAQDAIITADGSGMVLSLNRAAERIFGYSEDEVAGRPITDLVPPRFRPVYETCISRMRAAGGSGGGELSGPAPQALELAGLRRDGSEFPIELSLSTWESSQGRFFAAILRDITERQEAARDREAFERQLAQRALHDSLTGLPNRVLLQDRLEQAVARAGRLGVSVAVLYLDLDRFRAINDGFGHQAGDELLVAVASRLQAVVRPGDTVARTGGDEFAILCEEISEPSEALAVAERVQRALGTFMLVQGRDFNVTVSGGVAVGSGGAPRGEQLLRDAEVALERARQGGPGRFALYEDSMRSDVAERLAVEHDLRLALRDGLLHLRYQPIVDLGTGSLAGVEALVRWEHPERGVLLPKQFISLAEDTGLIVPLGRWVLEEACRQGATWQRQLAPGERLRVSVNVSARQFQQQHWAEEVATALRTGATVAVFPEGTTWCGAAGGRYRPAFFQAAIDANAPVRPVVLRYRTLQGTPATDIAYVDTLAGTLRRVLSARDIELHIDVLPAIHPRPGEDRRSLAARAQTPVQAPVPAPVQKSEVCGQLGQLHSRCPSPHPPDGNPAER
jgi:diguanylate cyclase (GGDEF)-like protein/PAS domain S-box-containing protein